MRLLLLSALPALLLAEQKPMTFLDVLHMRTVQDGTLSRDGRKLAYVVQELDWKAGKRFGDVWMADTPTGKIRQITYTAAKNETTPAFAPSGSDLAFLSDREGAMNLYWLSLEGGEARKISDLPANTPVANYAFSDDGKWIAYRAGRGEAGQLWIYDISKRSAEKIGPAGVSAWHWTPDSTALVFAAPAKIDPLERRRLDLKFDVRVVDQPRPGAQLWEAPLATRKAKQLTTGAYSVREFAIAPNAKSIAFSGGSVDRYEQGLDGPRRAEIYLLDRATGKTAQLTSNQVAETTPQFSPNGQSLLITSTEEFAANRKTALYVRPVAGGEWKKLTPPDDQESSAATWSADSKLIYLTGARGVNSNVFSIDAETGTLRQLSDRIGTITMSYSWRADRFILIADSPTEPRDYYVAAPADLSAPRSWKRASHANPQVAAFALGQYETIRWKSSDGATVEGVLVKPAGYVAGKKVPLIVQLHGGPASAYMNSFAAGYGTYVHVFAGNGYAVLQPNYRGSTNYGEKFRMQIAGDYFRQGFDDIMSGVDEVIRLGVADPAKLGLMGWSAGGHWSNWALTHTNRFKAISSGAGVANWISMYAQTDVQENREFYLNGKPWENWDHYVTQSPIRYIKDAKTPTLIHVGHDDARVPRPQSEELHMALKKLGVPTEFIVYPRMGHGITEPRYQMVKMASEFGWFERWIKGSKAEWLDWKTLVESVPKSPPAAPAPTTDSPEN